MAEQQLRSFETQKQNNNKSYIMTQETYIEGKSSGFNSLDPIDQSLNKNIVIRQDIYTDQRQKEDDTKLNQKSQQDSENLRQKNLREFNKITHVRNNTSDIGKGIIPQK